MASKKILLGILVIALVFGMTVVGCDNGSTTDNGGDYTNVLSTDGRLTISGLSSYNNNYIFGSGTDSSYSILIGAEGVSSSNGYTCGLISGGQSTIKVWKQLDATTLGNYNGYEEALFTVFIVNKINITASDLFDWQQFIISGDGKPSWLIEMVVINATFSGGVGTGSYQDKISRKPVRRFKTEPLAEMNAELIPNGVAGEKYRGPDTVFFP